MEQIEKKKFSWRWYHFLMLGAGLLLLLCIGGTVFLFTTPQFRDALQGEGQMFFLRGIAGSALFGVVGSNKRLTSEEPL